MPTTACCPRPRRRSPGSRTSSRSTACRIRCSGLDVPSEVTVAAQEARARAAGGATAAATRTRARTRSGVWLLIHASCLHGAAGSAADAAVVIEPAKASEVAPLIVDAYELTPREVDVTRALARGLTTNEIARELHLSRYTVQDHLKAVYEKAGVSSRGELVAKMFADHYHDGLVDAVHRAAPRRSRWRRKDGAYRQRATCAMACARVSKTSRHCGMPATSKMSRV